MEERTNVGYKIIKSVLIDNHTEIVLGETTGVRHDYVCWYCNDGKDYFWGIYTDDFNKALDKFRERINKEI